MFTYFVFNWLGFYAPFTIANIQFIFVHRMW